MPTGGFIGFAPLTRATGNAGVNSIFLTPLVARQSGIATAVLQDFPGAVGSLSFKALVYDGAHSALLATGSALTSVAANYNRFPLTANLNVTAGTTYFVGYVCANSLSVTVQTGGSNTNWFVSGGQNVTTPANPLASGALSTTTLMLALELDGTASQGFGFGLDYSTGVSLATSNTRATLTSAANQGARSIVTQVSGGGKFYAEIDIGGSFVGSVAVGLTSANWPITGYTLSGFAYAYLLDNTGQRTGSVSVGLPYTVGDTIGIAYDGINNFIWWNKNNGSWFGTNTTAGNPVTPTGGLAITAQNWPLTIFAGSTVSGSPVSFLLRDTAGALKYTPPSGYAAWSSATYSGTAATQARAMVLA